MKRLQRLFVSLILVCDLTPRSQAQDHKDLYGDPLPQGAVARLAAIAG